MATEIERKFLVCSDAWRGAVRDSVRIRQGYLGESARASVRVRLAGDRAFLNLKSMQLGLSRREYEYAIPVADAEDMLAQLCAGPFIDKVRFHVPHGGHLWEVDVFEGENAGLVVAELELADEQEPYQRPSWLGAEVSHDPRYYNVCLAAHPYKLWQADATDSGSA